MRAHRIVFMVLVGFHLTDTVFALAPTARTLAQVPITFTLNLVRIPVSVNGSPPFSLILDTGMPSPGILLRDGERVAALDLEFPGTESLSGGGSGPAVAARVAQGARIELGGLSIPDVPVTVVPSGTPLGQADGVIGMELFSRFVVRADVDARMLSLIDPEGFEPEPGSSIVPLRFRDDSPFVDARVTVAGKEPVAVDLAVDLGAGYALWLNERKPGRLAPPPDAIRSTVGRGIQGEIHGAIGRVERLDLGRLTFARVVTLFPAPEFHHPGGVDFKDGFIGAGLLTRCVVTFDYASRRMLLSPGPRFHDAFEWDMSGMVLAPGSGPRRRVDAVLPGSPAETAGIRPGDALVAVDDRPLAELGPDDVRRAFQRDGVEVRVTMERDGERVDRRIRLRRLI